MSVKVIKYLKWLKQTKTNYNFDLTGLQPFIFSQNLGKENNPLQYKPDDQSILACPFPLFSIEIEGDNFLINDEVSRVDCILCHEITVGTYDFLLLGKSQDSDERLWLRIAPEHANNEKICQLVNAAISRIHAKAIGSKKNIAKVQYKNSLGQKKDFKPSQIIYVSSQNKGVKQYLLESNIKWSHRWNVMSHWRKLVNSESFGVNRAGIRNVKGYTFINSHEKGDGEQLIKLRKVI